jgi:hypothetical protein
MSAWLRSQRISKNDLAQHSRPRVSEFMVHRHQGRTVQQIGLGIGVGERRPGRVVVRDHDDAMLFIDLVERHWASLAKQFFGLVSGEGGGRLVPEQHTLVFVEDRDSFVQDVKSRFQHLQPIAHV